MHPTFRCSRDFRFKNSVTYTRIHSILLVIQIAPKKLAFNYILILQPAVSIYISDLETIQIIQNTHIANNVIV